MWNLIIYYKTGARRCFEFNDDGAMNAFIEAEKPYIDDYIVEVIDCETCHYEAHDYEDEECLECGQPLV